MKSFTCRRWLRDALALTLATIFGSAALAQRAGENAVASASDAFGSSVGDERIGLYAEDNVRGFSPVTAGNRRIEGMYVDLQGPGITPRLTSASVVRVGLTAIGYPFPAPSGIVDYQLRDAGEEFVASVVAGLPAYGGEYVELDAQLPLGTLASMAAGAGYTRNEYQDGRATTGTTAALIPRLRFGRGSLTAFWTHGEIRGDVAASMVTAGAWLPPDFEPGNFLASQWIDRLQRTHTYGAIGELTLADAWSLRAAAFESRSTRYRSFIDLFVGVQPDGSARNIVISEPELPARWTSGDLRLGWTREADRFRHDLQFSLRARDKEVEQGGGAAVDLGPARVGVPNLAAEPQFLFQPTTLNSVRQWIGGVSYLARWGKLAELNAGLQTTRYRQSIARGDLRDESEADELLHNLSFAVLPTDWLAFYAGHTLGLEETAAPPGSAVNRDDVPSASRTRQWDAGVRVSIGGTRVVAGVFEATRPYFATDAANLYAHLGERRNRGFELSVIAQPLDALRIVAGAVYYDAVVDGAAVALGRSGKRPVGSSPIQARVDFDYTVAALPGFSTQLAVIHSGDIVASTLPYAELGGRQLQVPAATTFDIGARYRWSIGRVPVAARLQLQNVADEHLLRVGGSNTFTVNGSRRASLQLSADF
jgi:iron complex outermembrane recepter protein